MHFSSDQSFYVTFLSYWVIGGLGFTTVYAFVSAVSRRVRRARSRRKDITRDQYLAYVERELKSRDLAVKESRLQEICEDEVRAVDKSGRPWRELDDIYSDLFRL